MTANPSGANGHFPHSARDAVALYLQRGLAAIPVRFQSKEPALTNWPALRIAAENLDVYFPAGKAQNVGVLNGEPSQNTADADLDCVEAREAAPHLLPNTGWVFGRPSAPWSHWIYRTDLPLNVKADEYVDIDGKMIVELRGTKSQTVFPPSVWRSKEQPSHTEVVRWDLFTEAALLPLAGLRKAVRDVAVVALLRRHWPGEGWHVATLALAGGLLNGGVSQDHAHRLVEALWRTAGTRDKPSDRDGCVESTAAKLTKGAKVHGWPTLAKLLGDKGNAVVDRVRSWLGIRSATAGATGPQPDAPPRPKTPARPPEPYRPFPTDALPQPLRVFVEQAAASVGCDPVYVALPALSVAASLIGNSRAIRLKSNRSRVDLA